MTRSEVRFRLRKLGVETSRVLEIAFPTRQVIGLLVHVQYQAEFVTALQNLKIETLTDFDPLDPSNISDPNYQDLTQDDRAQLAAQIHANRCCRTIKFLRPSIARAVAQSFVNKGWISDDDITTTTARPSSHPFTVEDPADESMSDDLKVTAVDDVLQHSHSLDILFITETWLLSPSQWPTPCKQIHNYGQPVAGNFRGSLGISALINPNCGLDIVPIPSPNPYLLNFDYLPFSSSVVTSPPHYQTPKY
jgi:hypothetical protein